ncbi:MAG: S41 family peptidase [Lachnospiraceae bacterium]|nr:S41 family peptidase [Lachnospiraceae bacterium]
MKKGFALLTLCLGISASYGQPADVARYAELARTYGIVRYFSPNPYAQEWSDSDWMKVCALLVHRAETEPLEHVFEPLAPALSLSEHPASAEDAPTAANEPAQYWYYSGSGNLHIPFMARVLMPGVADYVPYYKRLSALSEAPDSLTGPVAGRYYAYQVAPGRYAHIRHALPEKAFDGAATRRLLADAKQYWSDHRSPDKSLSKRHSFIFGLLSDQAVRVADLAVRWNIVRHFYPYYDEEQLDWESQLERYLPQALRMERVDTFEAILEWYDLLCRLFNPIRDGHIFVRRDMTLSGLRATYLPEFHTAAEALLINDTLLLRRGGEPWRILLTIDNRPAIERLQQIRARTNAATEAHRDRLAADGLFAAPTFGAPFLVRSSDLEGRMREDTLHAHNPEPPRPAREAGAFRRYGDILYINATSPELNRKGFLAALTPDTKGLCFDLRGLPSLRFEEILAHLISSDVKAPATEVPVNRFPFQREVAWRIEAETLAAKAPHVALPATFLCDAATVSWGETILLMVRHYGLGTIVGQTTAGTTGDMTWFDLPLFPFSMTGMRMRGMDGEPHHARGVVPDQVVPQYARDCMTDYDRILDTALSINQ